jgi:hypothetical protein
MSFDEDDDRPSSRSHSRSHYRSSNDDDSRDSKSRSSRDRNRKRESALKRDTKNFEKAIKSLANSSVHDLNVRVRAKEILLLGKKTIRDGVIAQIDKLNSQIEQAKKDGNYDLARKLTAKLKDHKLMDALFSSRKELAKSEREYTQAAERLDNRDWAIKNQNENLLTETNRILSAHDSSSSPELYRRAVDGIAKQIEVLRNNAGKPNADGTVNAPTTDSLFGGLQSDLGMNTRTSTQGSNGTSSSSSAFTYFPRTDDALNRISILEAPGAGITPSKSIFDLGSTSGRLNNYLSTNTAAQFAASQVSQSFMPTATTAGNPFARTSTGFGQLKM